MSLEQVIIVPFILFLGLNSVQGQTFDLTDSTFEAGNILTLNIFFDFDRCDLKPESSLMLDSLSDFLLKNDQLIIEVGNHRDNKDPEHYNRMSKTLTRCRAENVVVYLIARGVDKSRLYAQGYGATKPKIPDEEIEKMKSEGEKEFAHGMNRRTEFKILRLTKN